MEPKRKRAKGRLKSGISVVEYQQGDERQLNDLFNRVFEKERPLRGWFWKFRDNPVLDDFLITMAENEEGEIVGMYPFLGAEFQVRDKLNLAVQCVEIAIHPEFRGRWTVVHLKEENWEERSWKDFENGPMKFGFGFPTKKHAKVGKNYMNYKMLGELPIMGLRSNWRSRIGSRVLRMVFGKIISLTGYIYYYYRWNRWAGDSKERDGIEITEGVRFGVEYDRLWDKISSEHSVMVHRSSRYLNWRYVENPMNEFTLLEARRGGKLVGYLVYTTLFEEGEKNGIIFDFFCPESEPGGKVLLKNCLFKLIGEKVKMIRCGALPHTSIYRYLCKLGFEKLPTSPPVHFELLDKDDEDMDFLKDLNHWYLSIGDTDLMGW